MKHNDGGGSGQNSKRKTRRSTANACSFKINLFAFSPLKLLRRAGADTTRVVRSLFRKKTAKPPLATPRPSSSQCESHHKEVNQDRIEFINSSFSRSNSVPQKAYERDGKPPSGGAGNWEKAGAAEGSSRRTRNRDYNSKTNQSSVRRAPAPEFLVFRSSSYILRPLNGPNFVAV